MEIKVGDKVLVKSGKTVWTVVRVTEHCKVVGLVNEINGRRAVAYFHEIKSAR